MKNYIVICFLFVASTVFSQNYFYALDEEPTAPDTENPSAPANLVATNVSYTTVDLSWTAASDNVGVVNYSLYNNGQVLVSSIGNVTNYTLGGLNPETTYNLTIRAIDAVNNESPDSNMETFITSQLKEIEEVRFIVVGASIMQAAFASGGMENFLLQLNNRWPDKTFSAFRHALSGQTMCSYVDSDIPNIDDTLSQYEPIDGVETIVLIHLGGNDVTRGRPFSSESENDKNSMLACYTEILDKIEAKGFKPLISDISFRNYDEGTPNNAYENEELGSKPYNDSIVKPLALDRTEFRYEDGESFMQFYNMVYNNWENYLGTDYIHVAGFGLTAFRDRIINEICDYIFNGVVPPRIIKDTPPSGLTNRFIMMGASIVNGAFNDESLTLAKINTAFPNETVELYNEGVNGRSAAGLNAAMDDILANYDYDINKPTYCFIHIGGNNVSNTRPFETATKVQKSVISDNINSAIDKIEAKGFIPILNDLTFRDYDDTTYENEEAGSKPYNDTLIKPLILSRTPSYAFDDGQSYMQLYTNTYNNYDTWLQADNIHLTATGYDAMRDLFVDNIVNYVITGNAPAKVAKNGEMTVTTSNMVSEQAYFDAVLLPITKKDSLQAYIDLYDHVRLEKGDYGRLNNEEIDLTTNQSIYGFPTETNTPIINILAGSSNVTVSNVNPWKVNLLSGAPITNSLISSMSNSTILSTGGQIEDNLFLNISRSGIELDFSASGYYRNNRVYRHQTQGSFLELLGNNTTPSYGNVHIWTNFLTPGGDGGYINQMEDISLLGFDSEGWNLRNQTQRNAMLKAENIGNIKITEFGGGNGYCSGCEQPAWDIQADNLFIFNKKIFDGSVDKSIARANTNVLVLEENHERDPYRKESGVFDVKMSTEYGLGLYDDNSIYVNDALVTSTITDQTTIGKIKENILQPKLTPIDRPTHEAIPDPLGSNWANERVGKPDSRAYIQNLIDTDTIAQLPEGIFYISGTLNINGDDAFKGGIVGAGTGKTVICGLTDDFPLITVQKFEFAENQQSRINLAHLTLQGGEFGLYFPTNIRLTSLNNWRYVVFRNQNAGIYLEQIFGMDNCFFSHLNFVDCDKGIWNNPKDNNDSDYDVMQDAGYIDKAVFYKNQFIRCNTAMQIRSNRGSNLNAWIECNFDSNGFIGTMGGQSYAQLVNCDFTNNKGNSTDNALFNGNGVSFYNCVFSGNTSTYTFNSTGVLAEGCSFLDTNQLMSSETHYNQSQHIINSTVMSTTLGGGWGNNQAQFINTSFPNIPALNKLMVTMKDDVITTIIDEAPNPYPQFLVKH